MRLIASLVLAFLLIVLAYAGFWWASLSFSSTQMKGAVEDVLGGKLVWAGGLWIPAMDSVQVRWPRVQLQMEQGNVRTVEASNVVMESRFFSRDSWRLTLPQRLDLTMASGRHLVLLTEKAEIVWVKDVGSPVFTARSLTLQDDQRNDMFRVSGVVFERRPGDAGVRLTFTSDVDLGRGPVTFTGQVVLPETVFQSLLAYVGDVQQPDLRGVVGIVVAQILETGRPLLLDNVSFKQGALSGAVFGTLQTQKGGFFSGQISLAANSPQWLLAWAQRAGLVAPRGVPETLGWRELQRKMILAKPVLRVETIPGALLLNGFAVGPVPTLSDVVARLWP